MLLSFTYRLECSHLLPSKNWTFGEFKWLPPSLPTVRAEVGLELTLLTPVPLLTCVGGMSEQTGEQLSPSSTETWLRVSSSAPATLSIHRPLQFILSSLLGVKWTSPKASSAKETEKNVFLTLHHPRQHPPTDSAPREHQRAWKPHVQPH